MFKKIAVVALVAAFVLGGSFSIAQAQSANLTISQLVELLISIGAIAPDKVAVARSIVASGQTPSAGTTSNTGVNTATAALSLSLDSANFPAANVVASAGANNNRYDKLPLLAFDVRAQNDTVQIKSLSATFPISGTGAATNAYLYDGSVLLSSASINSSTGKAAFSGLNYWIVQNTTKALTLKADVMNISSTPTTLSASVSSADMTAQNSQGATVVPSGVAVGNTMTVRNAGPVITLNSVSIVKSSTAAQNGGVSTQTADAMFNLTIQAVGGDVYFGTQAAASTFKFGIYKDGSRVTPNVPSTVSFSAPSYGAVTNGLPAGISFKVSQNNSVTLPVDFVFEARTADGQALSSGNYAVGLEGVSYSTILGGPSSLISSMSGSMSWRSASITLGGDMTVPTAPSVTAGPSTSLYVSANSISQGQAVTIVSTTNSPAGTLQTAAIDQSSDNVNWVSGAPCGYWSNTGGSLSAHTVSCTYAPPATGTYYFRARGADSKGSSSFAYATLTVTAAQSTQNYPTTQACSGSQPAGTGVNMGYSYYTTGYGTSNWTFTTSATPGACQWTCQSGYGLSGNGCAASNTSSPTIPMIQYCGGSQPASSAYTQIGNNTYSTGYGTTQWTFTSNGAPNACQYSCVNGGVYNGNGCVAPQQAPAPVSITAPGLSSYSWYADDPSTWPTLSTPSALNSNQSMRAKLLTGEQFYNQQNGVSSGRLSTSPSAQSAQMQLYVFDYALGQVVAQQVVTVNISNKPAPAPTPAPAPSASTTIVPPSLSSTSWNADDPSTWPTVSTPSALTSGQAMRVKGFNGAQFFDKALGVSTGRLTSSPAAGTTQLILYVYDYAQNGYAVPDQTVNVTITGNSSSVAPASSNVAAGMVGFDQVIRLFEALR